MKDQATREASMRAINNFMGIHNLARGKELKVEIDVQNEHGKLICSDTCKCYFAYQCEHEQYTINLFWTYGDTQLKALGLYATYNTNFQEVELADNMLIIRTESRTLLLAAAKE